MSGTRNMQKTVEKTAFSVCFKLVLDAELSETTASRLEATVNIQP